MMDLLGENAVVLEGLDGDENPLPDAYQISMHDLSKYDETIQQIQAIEGVDHYTDYSDIATKLSNIDMIVRVASLAIIVILAIVSLFIISNTVKVTMFSRRTEISIMKSVGATNGFVRIPFIVEGMLIASSPAAFPLRFCSLPISTRYRRFITSCRSLTLWISTRM